MPGMKIWYSVRNGGDGSAYPVFMECEEQAELDQKHMDEGWGESCAGYVEVESPSTKPITVKGITTIAAQIKDLENTLSYSKPPYDKAPRAHLEALKKLQEKQSCE